MTYFILSPFLEGLAGHNCSGAIYHQPAVIANSGSARRRVTLAHRAIVRGSARVQPLAWEYRPAVRVTARLIRLSLIDCQLWRTPDRPFGVDCGGSEFSEFGQLKTFEEDAKIS